MGAKDLTSQSRVSGEWSGAVVGASGVVCCAWWLTVGEQFSSRVGCLSKNRTTCARTRAAGKPGRQAQLPESCRLGGRKLSGPPLATAVIGWPFQGDPPARAPLTPGLANWPSCFGEQEAFHHYLVAGLRGWAADIVYWALGTRLLALLSQHIQSYAHCSSQ